MALNFNISVNNKTESWDEETLHKRLTDLKNAKKDVVWIRSDLSTKKSTGFGRFFWRVVGKRFEWLRKEFYKVDLEQSKSALNELNAQVKSLNDKQLTKLFNEAVLNFNSIAPYHTAETAKKNVTFSDDVKITRYKLYVPHMEILEKFQKELKEGADINELLKKAFKKQYPSVAAWLLKQGADIAVLEAGDKSESDLLNWLKLQIAEVPAIPENIDHYALTLGGGYKYANLKIMEAKAEKMSQQLKSSKVAVPPFLSLSDFEMTHALQQSVPEVYTLWTEFLDTFDPAMKQSFMEMHTDKEAAKVPVKISEKGEKILEEIKKKITKYYSEDPYFSLQMKEWLEKENPQFLIVRSTGKEDSDTNSNAGGNESVPFITPKPQDISDAIGTVVASYFGEKSITQRLAAGDRSLFKDEKPFVPVLLQVMVGENVAGKGSQNEDVPRCGVLFTRQSDKAKGVTFIQTGLGNNEGVVSSQVGVDSYYVKDGKIHAVVRNKDTRFVSIQEPSGKYKVAPIQNNNKALEMSQALPNPVILDIKRVADDISESYASQKGQVKPMDMEYVVKLKEKGQEKPVIYLLQARPLLDTQDKEGIEHSYLDLGSMKDIPSADKLTAETLLDGNAYVRRIEDPSEIIFVDDLPRGLDAYLKAKDPSKIKAIVSRKTAPATSHEAVTLRPKGVAVMVVNDSEKFKTLKQMAQTATSDKPLLADTQRGMFVKSPNGKAADEMIKKGLVSYPIPLEVTVPPSRLLNIPHEHQHLTEGLLYLFNKDCDHLIEGLLNGQKPFPTRRRKKLRAFYVYLNLISGKQQEEQVYNIRELFDIMATGEEKEAKRALGTVLRLMRKRLAKNMKETEDFRKDINQPMFQVFESAVDLAKKELIPALENYEPQSLERLYHLKFLEAMIFQTPGSNVMGAPSYAQVLATDLTQKKAMLNAAKEGIDVKNSDGQKMLLLLKMADLSFSEECRTNWKLFIKDITALPEEEKTQAVDDMIRMIIEMNKVGMTSIWMNKVFQERWKKVSGLGPGATRANQMLSELRVAQNSSKETVAWIAKNLSKLEARDQQISAWNDPSFTQKNTRKLIASFKGELGFDPTSAGPNSLKALYDNSDELGRLALMQYMRRAVDIYDRTIKTVKGSTEYKDDKEKALAVGELLKGYFDMMQATFNLVPNEHEQMLMTQTNYGTSETFRNYISKLKNGVAYHFGFNHLHGSIGFDNLIHYLNTGERKHDPDFKTYGHMTTHGQKGKAEFEEMFPTIEPKFSKQFSSQLEASKQFSVDALVIGSKLDYNFSVHWPNRLEEYFTTFHQNMEQIIKYLNTKNGMNTSLLSTNARKLSETITKEFNVSISSLGVEDDKIVVGYQIPLRQHSGSLVMKYNPKKPENGIDLEVQMFGNDEQRRWDKGAAVGVLLAHLKGAGFTDDAPPEIEYHPAPTGVKFSIHLDHNSKTEDQTAILKTLEHLMKHLTMDNNFYPSQMLNRLETGIKYGGYYDTYDFPGLGKIDWDKIPAEAFAHTLWMNHHLLNNFQADNRDELSSKVAINSLLGIARRKLSDYDREHDNSLKNKAVSELDRLMKKDSKTFGPLVAQMLNDPDVKEYLKDVVQALGH